MVARWRPGETFLAPLRVLRAMESLASGRGAEFRVDLALPGEADGFRFLAEVKGSGTPLQVQAAVHAITERVAKARQADAGDWWPLVVVPYLNPERLAELERQCVSGVDVCGNGVVMVPGRLWIVRSGQPNQYPETRPLKDPFSGKSSWVGRILLTQSRWDSLTSLVAGINQAGGEISLPQASKTIQALVDELMVLRTPPALRLQEPLRLLDRLGRAFVRPEYRIRRLLRLSAGTDWAASLAAVPGLRWAVTGETAVRKYAVFGEGGPWRVAVDDLAKAVAAIGGSLETVPAFADIELVETKDAAVYFQAVPDQEGKRWASRVQCWLELQNGDARQQQAAAEVRAQILKEAGA